MRAETLVRLVVEPANGGVLEGAVHAFDLAVGPRMVEFREAMIEAGLGTDQVKRMGAKELVRGQHLLDLGHTPAAMRRGELKAVVPSEEEVTAGQVLL